MTKEIKTIILDYLGGYYVAEESKDPNLVTHWLLSEQPYTTLNEAKAELAHLKARYPEVNFKLVAKALVEIFE